ncbi:MAG: hypothetical protein ABI810_15820 [Sphingomonas bacterium]
MEHPQEPRYTAAGTPIFVVWRNRIDRESAEEWQTRAPTLWDLRYVREADFTWSVDAVQVFFGALYRDSLERRIAEGHKGLLRNAATILAKTAIDTYRKACREKAVHIYEPYSEVDEMIEPIIDEMLNQSDLPSYSDAIFRLLVKAAFADKELTHNHQSLTTTNDAEQLRETGYDVAMKEHIACAAPSPKAQFNRALDIIAVYSDPVDRIKYRPLETLLTAATRVIYVIANRAY